MRKEGNGFNMVAGEGTKLKRQQLEREICSLPRDSVMRANLLHTFSKLFMFLEEDIRNALKKAEQTGRVRGSVMVHAAHRIKQ